MTQSNIIIINRIHHLSLFIVYKDVRTLLGTIQYMVCLKYICSQLITENTTYFIIDD